VPSFVHQVEREKATERKRAGLNESPIDENNNQGGILGNGSASASASGYDEILSFILPERMQRVSHTGLFISSESLFILLHRIIFHYIDFSVTADEEKRPDDGVQFD
jgi:hypothetical protein